MQTHARLVVIGAGIVGTSDTYHRLPMPAGWARAKKFCCLTFDDPGGVALGHEPIFAGDDCVGYVTTSNLRIRCG